MENKKYTVWQLFSIVDGRVSTSFKDVIDILSHVVGYQVREVNAHQVDHAIKMCRPDWYVLAERLINEAKQLCPITEECQLQYEWLKGYFEQNPLQIDVEGM